MSRPTNRLLAMCALSMLSILITASATVAQPPTHQWSQQFGSTSQDRGESVATDASGNVFMTGGMNETVDFGGGDLVSAGSNDIVLAKYSPTGTHLWSQHFGSTSGDYGFSVATDASGNVFMTGYFNETVDFGGGNLVSAGARDIFLAKYSPTGTHLWSQRFGSPSADIGVSVATDGSGNVFMSGNFKETVDFGGGDLVSAGSSDIVVAKYSPTGTHLWSQRFGSTGVENGRSVATDASGNVFMTGPFQGTVNFGGGALVSAGGRDIFLAMYSPTGTHLWSQRFGSTGDDFGNEVATDASGNVFMTVDFNETVDFGGGDLVSAGGAEIVLAKYSPAGTHLWSQRFGSTGNDKGQSVATDASGNVFMTAEFEGTVEFGGGDLVSAGFGDMVLAKYSPTGTHLWSQRFGGTGGDEPNSVATDASGNVFMTGEFKETVDFGGGNLVSAGLDDVVIMKYGATTTAVGDAPQSYALSVSNFPNPFNPLTTIAFELPLQAAVSLRVFDVSGRLVRVLISGEVTAEGRREAIWNGRDDSGRQVASGTYFYRLEAGDYSETKGMALIK